MIPIPYSFRHPREYVAVNVVGTLNVLQAARAGGVERVVQMSSSEVYGSAQTVPISEEHPLNAQSPYAATKIGADQLALSFQRSFDLPVVVARPFNTYGPRQSARAIIPSIAAQALTRDVVELGAVDPTRDFLYVGDNVAGLIRCGTVAGIEGETLNLGTGTEISIGELAEKILAALGSSASIVSVDERVRPPEAEVVRLVADASKARRLLAWSPRRRSTRDCAGHSTGCASTSAPTSRRSTTSSTIEVVVLAGGKGTRLAPYTTVLPKPLMPIGEMPVLEILLRRLALAGFDHVHLAVGYLAQLIEAYFGDGSRFGVDLHYLREESRSAPPARSPRSRATSSVCSS